MPKHECCGCEYPDLEAIKLQARKDALNEAAGRFTPHKSPGGSLRLIDVANELRRLADASPAEPPKESNKA